MENYQWILEHSLLYKFKVINKETLLDEEEFYTSKEKYIKFSFKSCIFREFPIFPHPEDLTTLEISKTKLEKIERADLKDFKNLVELYVFDCGLRKLNGDILRDLKNLSIISFARNKLQIIDSEIFDGLELIHFVDFRGNFSISGLYQLIKEFSTWPSLDDLKKEIKQNCFETKTLSCLTNEEKFQNMKEEIEILTRGLKATEEELRGEKIFKNELLKENEVLYSLKAIFDDAAFKDFTIHVGKSSFKIHKTLFAAHSSTLADIFKNNPNAQELNVQDISESIFKNIYEFIYENFLPDDANYLEIFIAASLLKIKNLKEIAALELLEKIDEKNALEVLMASNKFNHQEMRQKSFEIIQTKIFPVRLIDEKFAKQPEMLKELIETKITLDKKYEEMCKKMEVAAVKK
ncbi:hypothetical protein PVAND_017136 [Polypedilum vanderplanki]|uniref:BTB domain-containing protein n=1 Tax=Polypedilum vanderplanki TaxID=319348 RepID=A0A9J6BHD1_POLVA|nr:hypothetical protein PVAND_017136 [Polypedilum vanderplanki]